MKRLQMKRAVIATVTTALLLLALAGPSWAQTPYVNPYNEKIDTPNRCAIIVPLLRATTLLRAEGRCVSGLADGEWVYSTREVMPDGLTMDSVIVSWFKEGQAFGLKSFFRSNKGVSIASGEPSFDGAYFLEFFGRNGEPVALGTIYQKIDQAVAITKAKNLPVSQSATAKNLAKQWSDDKQGLFAKWAPPSSPAQSNQAGSSQDDPKTTGRGARGG